MTSLLQRVSVIALLLAATLPAQAQRPLLRTCKPASRFG